MNASDVATELDNKIAAALKAPLASWGHCAARLTA